MLMVGLSIGHGQKPKYYNKERQNKNLVNNNKLWFQ